MDIYLIFRMMKLNQLFIACTVILVSCKVPNKSTREVHGKSYRTVIHELNEKELPKGDKIIAFVGATLIDGNGGEPIQNSCVVVRNDKIELVGKAGEVEIPKEAEILNVPGQTLLPGLIDAHYHNEGSTDRLTLLLSHGITSIRDPGLWM